ncbi:MAG: glycoside hydrolase family 113 [Chloroflexota bacterium]|jgi:hypothetical protein
MVRWLGGLLIVTALSMLACLTPSQQAGVPRLAANLVSADSGYLLLSQEPDYPTPTPNTLSSSPQPQATRTSAETAGNTNKRSMVWQKAFAFWNHNLDFGSRASFMSLRRLKASGANTVSPVITWFVTHPYDVNIHSGKWTPKDEDLIAVVNEAHRLGLQVVFRLHIDCEDGTWRARINPDDKDAFFSAYRSVLLHYADLARNHNVEGMVIGAELSSLSGPSYTHYWRSMIAEVRGRFDGFLTYSAQWGSAPASAEQDQFREYEQIEFWPDLDYLGISAYFELTQDGQPSPTNQELVFNWDEWRKLRIEPFQARYDMPLIFTEVGYPSAPEAARHPWAGGGSSMVNLQLQAALYDALFESWAGVDWFHGAYLWFWPSDFERGGLADSDYPPLGKPAEQVLRNWYQLLDDMERPAR